MQIKTVYYIGNHVKDGQAQHCPCSQCLQPVSRRRIHPPQDWGEDAREGCCQEQPCAAQSKRHSVVPSSIRSIRHCQLPLYDSFVCVRRSIACPSASAFDQLSVSQSGFQYAPSPTGIFHLAPRGGRRLSDYGTEGVRKHPARR